jgi:septal ring-binding cell division protein DamX
MSASLPPPSLPTPASSTGYATESSTATYPRSNDRNDVFSPSSVARSITGTPANHSNSVLNTSSNTYGISRIHSPPTRQDNRQRTHHHQGATPTHTSAHQSVPPDLRTPMSAYSDQTHQWPPAHHMPISQFPALAGTQAARGSWDLAAYLDPSSGTSSNAGPGTGAGSSLQTGSGHLTGTSSYARSSGLQDPSGGGMDRQGQGQSSKGLDSSHQLPPS